MGHAMRGLARVQRFLTSAALILCVLVLGYLAVSHLFETSCLHAGATPESVTLVRDALPINLALTMGMIILLLAFFRLCSKRCSTKVLAVLGFAAMATSAVFLVGARTTQIYDFQYVMEAAQLFARGNYKDGRVRILVEFFLTEINTEFV